MMTYKFKSATPDVSFHSKDTSFADIVIEHINAHPDLKTQDLIKLAYQNEYGPAHLVSLFDANEYLLKEYSSLSKKEDIPLYEDIGNGYVRININSNKMSDELFDVLPIAKMFKLSADIHTGNDNSFIYKLNLIRNIVSERHTSLTISDCDRDVSEYLSSGIHDVSHSEAYRDMYHPAYRVIRKEYAELIPLVYSISKVLRASDKNVLIAIDGPCASGKTTIGNMLNEIFDSNLFHMDDYFLPPELRTEKRFAEPGGNVHYERFYDEIIKPIRSGVDTISYGVFDCSEMQVTKTESFKTKKLNIVEGSYSHHPYFGKSYDLKICLSITPEKQIERIIIRNGVEMAENFKNRWIPLENKYFEAFKISEKADIVIETE